MCLDLTLRAEGHTTLDDVMRQLWQRCDAGPMTEADLLAALKQLGKRSYANELAAWVHGTADLPLRELLEKHGLQWQEDPAPVAQQLGLRATESNGLIIKTVLRGSAAEAAGMAANDEWLAIELASTDGTNTEAWRVRKLDEVALYAHGQSTVIALVARDGRLLRCPLRWPAVTHTVRLAKPSGTATEPAPARWLQE